MSAGNIVSLAKKSTREKHYKNSGPAASAQTSCRPSLSLSLAKSDSPREGSPPRTGSLFAGSRNSAVPGRLEDARAGLEVARYREPRRRLAVRWELLPRI